MGNYVSKVQTPDGTVKNIKSYKTESIPMGKVASTSTSTVFTATIDGITELRDGVCVWLTNGVVTSAADFTININGLGAKPVYRSVNATTRETTRFDKNYTIFLIYNETRVSGGCWDYVYGFDSNTTYTNMTQAEASAGTVTTGRVIGAKVLSDTIEEHIAKIKAVLPELVNNGAKNWLEVPDFVSTVNGITFTAYHGGIFATGTATADASIAIYPKDSVTGMGVTDIDIVVSGCMNGSETTYRCFFQEKRSNTYVTRVTLTDTPTEYHMTNAFSNYRYLITIYSGCTVNNKLFEPMICTKAAWDISNFFFPYAKTNPELTICETQDRDAIIEVVNDGAKNLLKITSSSKTIEGVTFTVNADGTVIANGTATANATFILASLSTYDLPEGDYILSGCTGGSATTYDLRFWQDGSTKVNYDGDTAITVGPTDWNYAILIRSGQTVNDLVFRPMICTKAEWNISQEHVPYALPNSELTASTIDLVNNGAKNKLNNKASSTSIVTVNPNKTITINGTAPTNADINIEISANTTLDAGDYIWSVANGASGVYFTVRPGEQGTTQYVCTGSTTYIGFSLAERTTINRIYLFINRGTTVNNLTFKPMICSKVDWNISQEYIPYAVPNSELTTAAVEMIDSGSKNILNHTAYTRTVNNVTYTVNADKSITITSNGTNTQSILYLIQNYTGFQAGTYVLSGVAGTSSSSDTYAMWLKIGTAGSVTVPKAGLEFDYDGTSALTISIIVRESQTVNATFKPMLCTKADWDISQEYQPYRPEKVTLEQAYSDGTLIATNANLNDYTTAGLYYATVAVTPTLTNAPYTATGFRLVVEKNSSSGAAIFQTLVPTSQTNVSKTYKRVYENNAWGNWYVLSGPKATIQGVDEYIYGTGSELASNSNLNDYNYACKMYSPSAAVSATISNTPWTASGFQLITVQFITSPSYMQFLIPNTAYGKWYRRRYGSGAWSSWVEYDDASYLINGATAIASNTDMNTLKTPGVYTCASYSIASSLTNCAYKSSGFRCDVIQTSDTNCIRQIIIPNQLTTTGGNARYERSCVISSNTWSSWYKFEGTKIT